MSHPTPTAARPAAEFTHRQILTILAGLMMGMFLAALDQTIMATATRTIADDLNGFDLQAWATTAFLITSTISTPLYGKLSDIYGRRPFFLFAIGIFIVGSMLCGLSQNMYELAAFRAIQGIGAGGLMSLALAIIGDIVPPRERAKYQGFFLAVFGTASVLGPILGGFFAGADQLLWVDGWRWVFYLNVPIGIAAMAVVAKVLHLPHTRVNHRIDWPGAVALIVGLVPLLTVAEQGRTWGWDSGRSILCYVIGVVGLISFVIAERAYKDEALLPLRLFGNRTIAVGTGASTILGIAMFGGLMTVPLYLQIVKGSSATMAGLQMIPFVFGIMSGSIIAGQLIARTGRYRIFPILGSTFMVIALFLFSLVGADTPLWRTMLIMVLMGLGLGGNMQPMITAVQNAVSPREIGVATGAVTFFRSMGGTMGTAVFLSVLFNVLPGNIRDAYADAAKNPEFLKAAADPTQQQLLKQAQGGGGLSDTSFINKLTDVVAHPFKVGFSDSVHVVYLLAFAIMLVGLVIVFFLPEIPLAMRSAQQQRADDAAAQGDASGADQGTAGVKAGTEGFAH
ncbi:major facilitator transporter [Actinoplanes sp. SE50]|uniref:MDR family MFS transporter n=1 Tax=unclassified Actinoplanes TaxID=2626549 RepID=UPI00023ED1A1|nr:MULTISPECIES: MDR family MFS transporter [unclassified Actinoplanes]AEV82174.1 drug resistance transporter, EmrB/QacA subfamily [Actinoplanes sp. SE50/110]ATO80573.1 major facilitator transporter [Actinoplanes sp. SE50]SLL97979.1 MFS transporter [Actinoplanes sp. SE50/110]